MKCIFTLGNTNTFLDKFYNGSYKKLEQVNYTRENKKLNKSEIKEVASEVSVILFFDWLTI